jgi:NADPH:quinone reductase-like Zn-dependent oxidoreductase
MAIRSFGTASSLGRPSGAQAGRPGQRLHLRLIGAALLRDGALTAQVAAKMPLTEVAAAMELAESHTVVGKVILEP